ncbi:hypothetical protein IFM89_034103 [Coptis chinensis]|uniref:Cytochrome P450 n=1 Tax=Coptis chinensis TaxID=261450 RepID=A0A835M0A8_9MAGN|nr:hypothetical protein IFM89_034103 [Coptis chinensis]
MGYNYALFAFGAYGLCWREARKIAILEFLSISRLLRHVRASEVSTSIKELYQVWQANCHNPDGSILLEMKKWFGDLTLNVVVRMVARKRYFGASAKMDDDEGRGFQKGIKDFFHLIGLFVVFDAVPFLRWFDFQGHEKAMKTTAEQLDSILQRWLEEHRQGKFNGGTKSEPDFMDVMLSILEDKKLFGYQAGNVNKAMCLADTTLVTLTLTLALLLNNRHILKKVQEEIDEHIGKDRQVDESDIDKLEYLQAIVKETLRLYSAAALPAQHEAIEDCTVAGFHKTPVNGLRKLHDATVKTHKRDFSKRKRIAFRNAGGESHTATTQMARTISKGEANLLALELAVNAASEAGKVEWKLLLSKGMLDKQGNYFWRLQTLSTGFGDYK